MTRQAAGPLAGRLAEGRTGAGAPRLLGRGVDTEAGYGGLVDGPGGAPGRFTAPGRRSAPRVLLGAGLVVVCALAFALLATRAASPVRVLALARDVAAGQVLSAADLTTVEVSGKGATVPGLVPEQQEQNWVGRTLTGPLPAGQLLTPANLGPSAWPPAGQSVVAVPVQAGHLPAGVVVGSQVRVVLPAPSTASAPSGSSSGSAGGPAEAARTMPAAVVQIADSPASDASGAVVTGSAGASASITGDGAVLSLLMSSQDAAVVAASEGSDVAVILQGRGAGG